MKLALEQIQAITTGAEEIKEENGRIRFFRFNGAQRKLYQQRADLGLRSRSTAGIKLQFQTDSKHLSLAVAVEPGSSRSYFSFDIWVDGEQIGSIENFSGVELPAKYTEVQLPLGDFEKSFDLGAGTKHICIYFPWSVDGQLRGLYLDDGAAVIPAKRPKKVLMFGDSITQGYDALYSSNAYTAKLAKQLEADEWNKAVGGEHFLPELTAIKEELQPDVITVAYGTNDWSAVTEEVFCETCRGFFRNLQAQYPAVPTLVLTPIWRADADQVFKCGEFARAEELIRQAVADMRQVQVISGVDLVPHSSKYYADERDLHPNDAGFAHYVQNLGNI